MDLTRIEGRNLRFGSPQAQRALRDLAALAREIACAAIAVPPDVAALHDRIAGFDRPSEEMAEETIPITETLSPEEADRLTDWERASLERREAAYAAFEVLSAAHEAGLTTGGLLLQALATLRDQRGDDPRLAAAIAALADLAGPVGPREVGSSLDPEIVAL